MTQSTQKLRKYLFNYRRKNKLTQAELAKKLGVTRAYISRIERGEMSRNQLIFLKLIKITGLASA